MIFGQQQSVAAITPDELETAIRSRETPLGAYLGAVTYDAFQHSLPGAIYESTLLPEDDRVSANPYGGRFAGMAWKPSGVPVLSEDDWKASPWYRKGIPYDGRMTQARAQAKAEIYDADQYRAWLRQNRTWGVGTVAALVAGSVIGSAPDPVNYIPVFGSAFKVANATRVGAIMTRAGLGALDAGILTAAEEPLIASSRRQFGDDVSFADQLTDIALGAVIGGAGGAFRGGVERLADRHPEHVSAALQTLGEAADAVANDRPIDIDPAFQQAQTIRERLSSSTMLTPADNDPFARRGALAEGTSAWRTVGENDFRVRSDQSIDLGAVSTGDAQRLNIPAGPIRLTKGWDFPEERTGSGLFHISERHRKEILGFKGQFGKPVYSSVDEFVNDVVATYTHIGLADNGRLLIAKMVPGLKERIAVLELDPRQHMSDSYAQELINAGTLPKGDFYTVRTGGIRNPGWTMRRGVQMLPREAPEPVASDRPSAPGARGSRIIVGAPIPQRKVVVSDFEPRDWIDTVAHDQPKTAPERLAAADVAVGKPQAFTGLGAQETAAEHGINLETGDLEQMAEVQRLAAADRLTKAEQDALKEADAALKQTDDYTKAYLAAAQCKGKA